MGTLIETALKSVP